MRQTGLMPAVEGRVGVKLWVVWLAGVMGVLGVVVSVAVGVYLIRKYRERKWGRCTSTRRLDGKVKTPGVLSHFVTSPVF
ncbi:hypothetical protein E2C01_075243 [Portunus trituberculatus]|uniref:Uncharacterized protein n=1 Tax=Portunus trituberculatus TaxID=210409 RepID=A0A5B7IGK7_PORTR|nr:hypothetical protein [Portunus trituberculatus]